MKRQIKSDNHVTVTTGETPGVKNDQFPIVGIGASAGGLEALEQFFGHMPENSGMGFVVVQHLDPNHKGILTELLQRVTKMEVRTVTDRLKVKPNCVYVIPANTSMSILNGSLHLFEPIETRGLRMPVDFFLRSLADDLQEKSIAIILSGMGSDGSIGLKAIKENLGLVLVQDPGNAKFNSMPRSAIEAVVVDIVAPAHELPAKLLAINMQVPLVKANQELEKDSSSLEKIIIILRTQTGNDFSQYKKTTLYRRIERRMGIHQIHKIASYVRYLRENPAEVEILFKELLIGVTNFFRDTEVWDQLKNKILPALFDKLPHSQVVRTWIPGCSTGEEAYSLAIVFKEVVERTFPNNSLSLQIFATDLDAAAIEKARKGIFPSNIIADVSPDRLSRFFIKTGDQYRVNAEIREMVVFATQNVIKDPPFTKLNLLSCRNLLIYLDASLQKKLLALFHYSLQPGGILILGSAETTGVQSDLFTPVDSKFRMYKRSGEVKREELDNFPSSFTRSKTSAIEGHQPAKNPDNLQALTDQLLLQQYTPASLLVTDKGDILYITGSTGKYLEPAAGKANMNIYAMAREGLRNELPMAFRHCLQSYEKLVLRKVKVGLNGGTQVVDVTFQQIEKPLSLRGKILIVFNDVDLLHQATSTKKQRRTPVNLLNAELDNELQRVREDLKSTQEEMQTSQEELQSTNEEMQSTNEELQSTNEELTTSKEEMQSMNEELNTLNAELQSKIDDAARLNNDMNNLLNSIHIATLFLEKDLRIRQFTYPATNIFKLIPSDIGRPFTDLVNDLVYPELYNDVREVQRNLEFMEKTVATYDGRWFTIRIMPYRTLEDKIDGLVITFIDATKTKLLESVLQQSKRTLQSFIQIVPSVLVGLSSDGTIIEFNAEAEKLFGCKHEEVMGKKYADLFIPLPAREQARAEMKNLLDGELPNRFVNLVQTTNGDHLQIEWSAHELFDDHGKLIGMIAIGVNITKS